MKSLALLFACAFCATSINAATIHIPADQPTIQAGIDAAVNGDTVLVASGTYSGVGNFDIQLKEKPILVKSESGHRLTIIDCQGIGRGFTLTDNEDTLTVIEGFKVINGVAFGGGAVACINSSPLIRGCLFKGNNGGYSGGAVFCENASPILQDCIMDDNYVIDMEGPLGGSLACYGDSHPELRNCNFLVNSYGGPWLRGYDIACSDSSTVILKRCILMGDILCVDQSECAWVECSDILWGGALATINQNFTADPMFCDTANDNYFVYSVSTCAPQNNSCSTLIGALEVGCCCIGMRGNVDGDPSDAINVADLTYLVDYLFFGGDTPPCPEEGNVDADGEINVADVTYLVDYIFFNGPAPLPCPSYSPTYQYIGYDTNGVTVVQGWINLIFSDSNQITGTWQLDAVGDPENIGPQVGSGNLVGSKVGGEVWINLNPDYIDFNVWLRGTIQGSTYSGIWEYVGFPGVLNHGSFEAAEQ